LPYDVTTTAANSWVWAAHIEENGGADTAAIKVGEVGSMTGTEATFGTCAPFTEPPPLDGDPIYSHPKVVLTPHVSWTGGEDVKRLADKTLVDTFTANLVTLPGAFVGVLIGSGDAMQAGAAQLLVLIGLIAAEVIAVLCTVELVARGRIRRPAAELAAPKRPKPPRPPGLPGLPRYRRVLAWRR